MLVVMLYTIQYTTKEQLQHQSGPSSRPQMAAAISDVAAASTSLYDACVVFLVLLPNRGHADQAIIFCSYEMKALEDYRFSTTPLWPRLSQLDHRLPSSVDWELDTLVA